MSLKFLLSTPNSSLSQVSVPPALIEHYNLRLRQYYDIKLVSRLPNGEYVVRGQSRGKLGSAPTQSYLSGMTRIRSVAHRSDIENLLCWIDGNSGSPMFVFSAAHPNEDPELCTLYASAWRVLWSRACAKRPIDGDELLRHLRMSTQIKLRAQCLPGILDVIREQCKSQGLIDVVQFVEKTSTAATVTVIPENLFALGEASSSPEAGGLLPAELEALRAVAPDLASAVLARGAAQSRFRKQLMLAYCCSCVFCGIRFPEALEAAHIEPWARCSAEAREDVRNGILLCATHHRLFDAGVLGIAEDRTITVVRDDVRTEIEAALTDALSGKTLRKPQPTVWEPAVAFIRKRREHGFSSR